MRFLENSIPPVLLIIFWPSSCVCLFTLGPQLNLTLSKFLMKSHAQSIWSTCSRFLTFSFSARTLILNVLKYQITWWNIPMHIVQLGQSLQTKGKTKAELQTAFWPPPLFIFQRILCLGEKSGNLPNSAPTPRYWAKNLKKCKKFFDFDESCIGKGAEWI